MPPRKRPPAGSRFSPSAVAGPSVHLEPFLHYLKAECGMAENTVRAYRADVTGYLAWYREHGPAAVSQVDLKLMTAWLQHLREQGLAASSVARHLVSVKMFFRYLVLEGVLLESVVELLSSPKLWQHLPKVVSPEMIDRMLAEPSEAAGDRYAQRDRALLSLMYATGCRTSEVTGLELRDVNLDEQWCRCTGKGNKQRMVSLNPVAVRRIRQYISDERTRMTAGMDSPWLFVSRSGRALTRIMVWNLVKKYAARVGCSSQVSPHTLRHSFATHMLAGGAEIRALQEMLGHASIQTTQVYTHVEHSRLKSVHQKCHPRG